MEIKTDNKWKNFKTRYEVPKKILKSQFDYQDEEDAFDGYILFKGKWYHTDQFTYLKGKDPATKDWDGYAGDTYFSGTLIKLSEDGEQYKIASYTS